MLTLILGLILFLGAHSVRIVADDWRTRTVARLGPLSWRALYSLVSLLGLALIVWGYAQARQQPVWLWSPPIALRHLNGLFMLAAFVLLAAAYVPRNQLKARLHHPMLLSVKLWAFGHLLASGTLASVLLFGAFLLWAVVDFRAARQRDRALGTTYAPGTLPATVLTVALGVGVWVVFAFWLHGVWLGIAPFGIML